LTAARFETVNHKEESVNMIETTMVMVIGIDMSRDWLDGFGLSGLERFRLADSAEDHKELISMIRQMSGPVHVGFEATGGQE
jgi:transposase